MFELQMQFPVNVIYGEMPAHELDLIHERGMFRYHMPHKLTRIPAVYFRSHE
jgi:hypothetical protein